MYHEANGEAWHCPVRALARRHIHLRENGADTKTFFSAYYDDKLVYELTFDIPDAGLLPPDDDPGESLGDERDDTLIEAVPGADDETAAVGRRYPSRACRSVIGNQPCDAYAPHTTFT